MDVCPPLRYHRAMMFLWILLASGLLLVLRLRSQRGREPDPAGIARRISDPARHDGRRFLNDEPAPVENMGAGFFVKFFLARHRPPTPLPVVAPAPFPSPPAPLRVVWMGHSFVILDIDGVRLIFDPVFGPASPLPTNIRRFQPPPLSREELPPADAVILSHDHYDHLERASVRFLARRGARFVTTPGVDSRLRGWGCSDDAISVLDWGQSLSLPSHRPEGGTVELTAAPSRHFSGRSLNGRDTTLWASWIAKGPRHAVFFSSDGGYGRHFAAIGRQYGPFDLTLMETGAWNPRWAHAHQHPEESVRAHRDLRGGVMLPIHWAAYDLAFHDWDEPAIRASRAAREQGVTLATPRMGETWTPGTPTAAWWEEVHPGKPDAKA